MLKNLYWTSAPTYQEDVEECQLMEFTNNTGQLIEDSVTPLEFRIPKSDYLIDLGQLFLKFKVKVTGKVKSAAKNTPPGAKRAKRETPNKPTPCTQFGYAMFSQVEMKINNEIITSNQSNYQWMTYILHLLHYTEEERNCLLHTAMWIDDTPPYER